MPQVSVSAEKARPASDAGGEERQRGPDEPAADDARQDQRAGDAAHLSLQAPPLPPAIDRQSSRLPGGETAVEDVQARQLGLTQGLLRLSRAGTGAADEDHRSSDHGAEIPRVLGQLVEWHVVAARDVGRLELGGRAHVEDRDRHLARDKIASACRRRAHWVKDDHEAFSILRGTIAM